MYRVGHKKAGEKLAPLKGPFSPAFLYPTLQLSYVRNVPGVAASKKMEAVTRASAGLAIRFVAFQNLTVEDELSCLWS